MSTTLIDVYNAALRHLGERRLTSTSEARDARYHLDDAMVGAKARSLEAAQWNFAHRSVSMTSSATLTVAFGFSYAFEKPTDWVRTYIISPTEDLREWLHRFNDEGGIWYADVDPLYAKYVSNDSTYGYDLALWPQSFADYVAIELAISAGPTISSTAADKLDGLMKERRRIKSSAEGKDISNEPPMYPPSGTWARSRSGGLRGPVPSNSRTIP